MQKERKKERLIVHVKSFICMHLYNFVKVIKFLISCFKEDINYNQMK